MVTPAARREAVAHLRTTFGVSERRACEVLGADRTSVRYRGRRADDAVVRARLRELAANAVQDAAKDAGIDQPDALYISNMLAPRLSDQAHLGALVADYAGWRGIEAATVEAACASGGVAFQAAIRAVMSGMIDVAAVCGVEKMTDSTTGAATSLLSTLA